MAFLTPARTGASWVAMAAVLAAAPGRAVASATSTTANPFQGAIGVLVSPGSALPSTHPMLGYLVGGFALLVIGLAALTVRREPRPPLESAAGTTRALLYALVYGLCTACFMRVIGPALLGQERSPWLLALGDVTFVTLGLFVWVMVLAEGWEMKVYGLVGGNTARLPLAVIMGIGAAVVTSFDSYRALVLGRVIATPDSLVFSLMFAIVASALPEEILFRGFLQSTLAGRSQRWARVAIPALAFTALRALRFPPGTGLGSAEWMVYIFGVVLPLGLWWGLMRELSGGSLWPSLVSHFLVAFGTTLANTSPPPS